MENENEHRILPLQSVGKEIIVKESVAFKNEKEASDFFMITQQRLQNVNAWSSLTGILSADFQLHDSSGNPVNRHIEKGDFFRINIPGPGTQAGDGYDWVQIEAIENYTTPAEDLFSFRVRPTHNPGKPQSGIAHFYSAVSTSTFSVHRNKGIVTVEIYDRNIKPNTEANSSIDKFRDTVVGTAGMIAFSKLQWAKLANGILKGA